MNNILNKLSPEAQSVLSGYSACNVGIVRYEEEKFPSHVRELTVFHIGVYDSTTIFSPERRGVSAQQRVATQPKQSDSFLILVNGSTSDAGELKGLLKKYGKDGFLYKPFNETTFQDNSTIKYDYTNKIVKLVEPYSFLKGGGRKW